MQGRIDIRVMQQDQQHRNASNGVELGNLPILKNHREKSQFGPNHRTKTKKHRFVIFITEDCAPLLVGFANEVLMFSRILLTVAAVSTVFTVAAVRRLRKPTCRVCLYRQFCPNRESEYSSKSTKPCWSCGQNSPCTEPNQTPKA